MFFCNDSLGKNKSFQIIEDSSRSCGTIIISWTSNKVENYYRQRETE